MTTGERIRELRLKQGLSQGKLGDFVGCSGQVISNIERGYTGSNSDVIGRIAAHFHVPAGYLLGLSDVNWRPDNNGSDPAIISARIKSRLDELGIQQGVLQIRSGIPPVDFEAYCAGEARPDVAALAAMAKALETTIDYLIGSSIYPTAVMSEDEEDMVLYFRAMSKSEKRIYMGMLEGRNFKIQGN